MSILHSIRWVSQAWEAVKCFRKAGILDDSLSVVTCPCQELHLFMEIDSNASEIESLVHQIQPEEGVCTCAEFINGDNDLATCFETDDDSWDQQFLASLESESTTSGVASDPEEEEEELQPPQPKVRNLCEAIANLEDVKEFLDSKGHVVEATMISSAVDKLAILHFRNRQSSLDQFLLLS